MAKKWSDEEINLLKTNYNNMNLNELYELFIKNRYNRNKTAIDSKSCNLKLYKKYKKAKEGYRFCKKCDRELPLNTKYFPKINGEKDFRHVCRECSKHYKGFLEKENNKIYWSNEDNEKFMELYPLYTNEELINKFYPNLNNKQITDKAYKLKIYKNKDTLKRSKNQQGLKISKIFKGREFSEEHRNKISETRKKLFSEGKLLSPLKNRIVTEEEKEISRSRVKGKWDKDKNPRHIKPLTGKDNGNWKGGITNLYQCLRENISEWKNESMYFCNYKCLLTGKEFNEIHHLVSFKDIVDKTFKDLNLEFKQNIQEYNDVNKNKIIDNIKALHKKYGLGICLNRKIHKLFHNKYGYTNFTKEQFKEFIKRYFNGEFDNELENKLKSINSNTNYEEAIKIFELL